MFHWRAPVRVRVRLLVVRGLILPAVQAVHVHRKVFHGSKRSAKRIDGEGFFNSYFPVLQPAGVLRRLRVLRPVGRGPQRPRRQPAVALLDDAVRIAAG